MAPDPAVADLFKSAESVEANVAPARPYLDAAQSLVINGSADMVSAGVASQIAAADAGPITADA